ncbi:MAG: AraC family transcriptional regulator [Silicimonas sp.]|nr:AraC family transcriptional regulator [Silicimonas sp.]
MDRETFHIASYIRDEEAFHFARKHLAKRFPDKAHDHDFYEVFLIESGRTAHWINGESQSLGPGQLMFIRPGDCHAFKADRDEGCQIINVMFRIETARHMQARYGDTIGANYFASTAPLPQLHNLGPVRFERAVNVAQQLKTAHRTLARIEEFLLTLINRVADVSSQVDALAPPWFVTACSAIQAPEMFREGAAAFVEACGRSHEHVCRTTQQRFGMTPTQYVNQIRIQHAAHLLRSDDLPIGDLARQCGFENTGYFYRLFRESYGTTPKAYRRRHQRNPF